MENVVTLEPVDFNPFAGPEIADLIPAIEPQLEIFTSCMLGGEDANRSYNESISLEMTGEFNQIAFESALYDLVDRHEALRSSFSADGMTMCIYSKLKINLSYKDFSAAGSSEQKTLIEEYSLKDVNTSFDLLSGPLFRVSLFKLADHLHYVTLTAHHIICDGWSIGIIMQELSKLYSAYALNTIPHLQEALKFSEYAREQSAFSLSEEYLENEKYWLDQFRNNIPSFEIEPDFPRPATRTYKSQRYDYAIDKTIVAALKKTGAKAGSSFVSTLLSAFEVFLYKLTGNNDIVLGLPAAGQSATGNYALIGHCVNLLPLRSRPGNEMPFTEYLKERKTKIFNDYDHQQFTYGSLLKKLNIVRDTSRIPLVPLVFNIDMGLADNVDFYGLKFKLISNPREYENFEIFINATGSEESFVLEWSYNTQLFSQATIARMMNEFEYLIHSIIQNPAQKIKDISLRDNRQVITRLNEWHKTSVDYPKEKSLTSFIDEASLLFPEKIAVRSGKKKITYKDLIETSDQLASLLISQGIKTGDVVGIALDRSAEIIIALIATMKAGAAYVPLDPEYPQERIEFMLADSSAKILLTASKYKNRFNSDAVSIVIEDAWQQLSLFPKNSPPVSVTGNDLAYILYTSGSTGKPKGVQIKHHNLVNFLLSMQKDPGITYNDRLLAITTISFDISGLEIYLPLINGAEIVLADSATTKDARLLTEILRDDNITFMQATPSTWRMMIDSGWPGTNGLKVLCGGEALPKELAADLLGRCDELWNVYGPTETTIWSTIKRISVTREELITIGRPIANTQVYVLDENRNPLPAGLTGEIYIGGDGVAKGYLNRPELTSERFINNPFDDNQQSKIYRTGDIGKFLDNGEIQCLGRTDHQVKIRGHRIELGEIEYALSKESGIKQAVVVAREDKPGDQRLVAYILEEDKHAMSRDDIEKWKKKIGDVLPSYMIPDDFVAMQSFPLTPNNKIDKKALPKPEYNTVVSHKQNRAPGTPTEKIIADIWQNLLGLQHISADADFFESGGHSLIAVQVMIQIEKKTGKRLPLTALFDSSTIEKLSKLVEADDEAIKWDCFVPIKTTGKKMPVYFVHGRGLNVLTFREITKYLDEDQPVYGLQAKGLNGKDEPLSDMKEIATHYINEILKHNPDGPYAIAGYSFGGLIAFEMAKQFKAMGKEMAMLGMFDTDAWQSDYYDPLWKKITGRFSLFFKRIWCTFVLMTNEPGFILGFRMRSVKRKLLGLFEEVPLSNKQKDPDDFFEYSKKIIDNLMIAERRYKFTKYNGAIDLFRAKRKTYYLPDFEFLGWKKYALDGVNVYEVPGDHSEIFNAPNVQGLAKELQKCLDKASGVIKIASINTLIKVAFYVSPISELCF